MSHPEVPEDDEDAVFADDEESQRGEGVRSLPTKADIALWRRALRENWPLSADDRSEIVRSVMEYFILAKSGRDKLNAAKVLMLADALNVKRASMIGVAISRGQGQPQPQANVNVNVGVGVQVQSGIGAAIAAEPEYLDWLKQRELEEARDAAHHGSNGFRPEVRGSEPPLGTGSGGD